MVVVSLSSLGGWEIDILPGGVTGVVVVMDLGGVSGVLYGRWGAMPLTATVEEPLTGGVVEEN